MNSGLGPCRSGGSSLRPRPWRTPPVEVRHARLSLVFHRRFEADAGHAWLRRLILAVAREVEPAR